MKLKKMPEVQSRNRLALDPLLKKGGVHHKERVEVIRLRDERCTRQWLEETDWLAINPETGEPDDE